MPRVAFVEVWPSLTIGPAPDEMIKECVGRCRKLARQVLRLWPLLKLAQVLLTCKAPKKGGYLWGWGLNTCSRQTTTLRMIVLALRPGVIGRP